MTTIFMGLVFSTRVLATTGFVPSRSIHERLFTIMSTRTANEEAALEQTNNNILGGISILGGDYAGLSATFSAKTGELIPVPEYLVPSVLLEWGQGPSCLEVIVSETVDKDAFVRHTVSVVPDVGCGVDNLDTMKETHVVDLPTNMQAFDNSVVALDYTLQNKAKRHEATFALNGRRMRVMVDVQDQRVKTPITLVLERKTSIISSGGMIADSGGLDGRTVSRLLDDLATGKTFAEMEAVLWEAADDDSRIVLNLPGNVTVSFNDDLKFLEIGHFTFDDSIRRVVKRSFDMDGTLKSIDYFAERKA